MNFSLDRLLRAGVLLAALYPLQSYAATISGLVCEVSAAAANDANNAHNMPAGAPCAQFSPTTISFNQQVQTSFNTLLNTPFSNQTNGFSGSDLYTNFLIEYTGQTFLNAGANTFVVAHDDGVVLTIGGVGPGGTSAVVVNAPGPTSASNSPFTVNAPTAGLYSFTLDYAECCGPPAVLNFVVNAQTVSTTPEPTTIVLIGSALVGLSLARFRKRA
jgi:hypothetical protein